MKLTNQQRDFVTALTTTDRHIALVARAGTGKTTTILEGVSAYHRLFPHRQLSVCAFNKAIAEEIKGKLAGYPWPAVEAGTIHSMGYKLVKYVFKSVVEGKKVANLIAARNEPVFEQYAGAIADLVRYAKGAGVGFFPDAAIGNPATWYALAEHYDVNGFDDTTELDLAVQAAQSIYRASLDQTDVVDFDDMILFPLIKGLRVKFTRDLIFLDEAQDLSRTRQALARKFLTPLTGRMVVVGDDCQAIYGFSGADAEALQNLTKELNAVVLPLNVTWRCPQAVVREAQTYVSDIQCATDNAGEVLHLGAFPEDLQATDAILCRNTAPLITIAYSLIRKGVACKVEGRSIGDGLLRLVNRWKVTTIDAFLKKLEVYKDREIQKAMARGNDAKVEEITDRVSTLQEICGAVLDKKLHRLDDVRAFINDLFADEAQNVLTLATYHRAKGREWTRVFLFEHGKRCPSRAARLPWQQQQERNLAYVAITRAKQTLAYVGSSQPEPRH